MARIDGALAFVGLQESAGKLVRTFSGGMVRRLEIVQSMLHRPPVLFLDEPTIGLDPAARRGIWEELRDLTARAGTTLFLTTHDMEEADALCDEVAIMRRGRVVTMGTPDELKAGIGPHASLDDVFIRYSGDAGETEERGCVRSLVPGAPRGASADQQRPKSRALAAGHSTIAA